MNPQISVLMPSYNHADYLQEAIGSVLGQQFSDLELIVVDDASKDESPSLIRRIAARDRRLRPILRRKNRGIAFTFNQALALARGRFVSFLASDDLWVKHKLARQIEVLQQDQDCVVYSDAALIDARGRSLDSLATERFLATERQKDGCLFPSLLLGNFICLSSLVMRTDHLRLLGFDETLRYLNDYKLLVQISRRWKFHFLPEPLLLYRMHRDNASRLKDTVGWRRDARELRRYFLAEFGSEIPEDVRRGMNASLRMLSILCS